MLIAEHKSNIQRSTFISGAQKGQIIYSNILQNNSEPNQIPRSNLNEGISFY